MDFKKYTNITESEEGKPFYNFGAYIGCKPNIVEDFITNMKNDTNINDIDIIFVIDKSGSMNDCLKDSTNLMNTKSAIVYMIIEKITNYLQILAKNGRNIYMTFIPFNDFSTVTNFRLKVEDSAEFVNEIHSLRQKITPMGGTDIFNALKKTNETIDKIKTINSNSLDNIFTFMMTDGYHSNPTSVKNMIKYFTGDEPEEGFTTSQPSYGLGMGNGMGNFNNWPIHLNSYAASPFSVQPTIQSNVTGTPGAASHLASSSLLPTPPVMPPSLLGSNNLPFPNIFSGAGILGTVPANPEPTSEPEIITDGFRSRYYAVGIGEPTDYDSKLLTKLFENVNGSSSVDELNDAIVSYTFGACSTIFEDVTIKFKSNGNKIITNLPTIQEDDMIKIVIKKMDYSQKIFIGFEGENEISYEISYLNKMTHENEVISGLFDMTEDKFDKNASHIVNYANYDQKYYKITQSIISNNQNLVQSKEILDNLTSNSFEETEDNKDIYKLWNILKTNIVTHIAKLEKYKDDEKAYEAYTNITSGQLRQVSSTGYSPALARTTSEQVTRQYSAGISHLTSGGSAIQPIHNNYNGILPPSNLMRSYAGLMPAHSIDSTLRSVSNSSSVTNPIGDVEEEEDIKKKEEVAQLKSLIDQIANQTLRTPTSSGQPYSSKDKELNI